MTSQSPESTILDSYPEASKDGILHAAATIVKKLCLGIPQKNIDGIKFDVYRFLTGKEINQYGLQSVLGLIEANKVQVVLLLSEKPCIDDHIDLARKIIVELSDKIKKVLRGESIAPPGLDSDVPSITDEGENAVDRVFVENNHNKKRRNTFPISEGHTVSIVPERNKGFRITVSDGHEYFCTEYSVERYRGFRSLIVYHNGTVISAYTLLDA